MPLAFRNGGLLFGVIGTIVIGYLATLCVHMLVSILNNMSNTQIVVYGCRLTHKTSLNCLSYNYIVFFAFNFKVNSETNKQERKFVFNRITLFLKLHNK